jgi:hypothetical protein
MKFTTITGTIGIFSALWVPAAAQDLATDASARVASEQVCMVRALRDVPQVPRERQGQPVNVLASSRSAKALEEKGFAQVECTSARLALGSEADTWRDEICELAAFGNIAVQNQLETALGERPAVLCAMAQEVAGPWDQRRTGKITTSR